MIYRNFSKRQALAMTWWNRPGLQDREGILCHGSVRSGKTLCMSVGFFLWSMACFQGQVFGLCGKTIASLRRNIVENLPRWLGVSSPSGRAAAKTSSSSPTAGGGRTPTIFSAVRMRARRP